MSPDDQSPWAEMIPVLDGLLDGSEPRTHRDVARIQVAVQERCDELYEEALAELSSNHDPEEARRIALERVRRSRAASRAKVEEAKRIAQNINDCRSELMMVLRDYCVWSSRLAHPR